MDVHKKICIPGERLFEAGSQYMAGEGTCVQHGNVYSTRAGCLHIANSEDSVSRLVEVRLDQLGKHCVPFPGSVVTAKVIEINSRFCKCSIMSVESCLLSNTFNGSIRKEDIRQTERDTVEVHKCFRPGDVILAKVLSLGDAQSFLLTTADDKLGVVSAVCDNGHTMQPVAFEEIECSHGCGRQQRKLAKLPYTNSIGNGSLSVSSVD